MLKRTTFFNLLILILAIGITSCQGQKKKRVLNFPKTDLTKSNLIPKPVSVKANYGGFALDTLTIINTSVDIQGFEEVGQFLANKIKLKTALVIPVNNKTVTNSETVININFSNKQELQKPESYSLEITKDSILLRSKTAEGAFRGIQTIRQLIPNKSNDTLAANKIWVIPTGNIIDYPQFEYRSTMLDVARHFFNVQDVKKYIDILSYYKFNKFHIHLSDDQGWRIEIKSWPKLTEIGGSTEVGGESGGYYTQEEYSEIVNFAQKNYITVIPEIDMPGHTNAASVSYPILNGNGKTPKLFEGMKVGFSTFDTRKDTVYNFIDDVIREVSSLSPGPYFHIGGDESHVTKKDDYKYFVNRVEKIVHKHEKKMIGWDEVANTDIDSASIAQFWATKKNIKAALDKKMKVILSPGSKAYLDMKYNADSKYGLKWAGYIPTDSAYIWSPESYLIKKNILGIEAPLWSETISNIDELEYLAFPRVIGISELAWTIPENRNWNDYKVRLANQAQYLKRMNVKYYPSSLIDWEK